MVGVPYWQNTRITQEKRILFNDIARALAFARAEAFLRGETLELLPLQPQSNHWNLGIKLQLENKPSEIIHQWPWHFSKNIQLTWHGFRGQDKLIVSSKPESLAINGYFLLKTSETLSERWVVSRFGRIRLSNTQYTSRCDTK